MTWVLVLNVSDKQSSYCNSKRLLLSSVMTCLWCSYSKGVATSVSFGQCEASVWKLKILSLILTLTQLYISISTFTVHVGMFLVLQKGWNFRSLQVDLAWAQFQIWSRLRHIPIIVIFIIKLQISSWHFM